VEAATWIAAAAVVVSVLAALYSAFGKRDDRDYARFAEGLERIAALEKTMISREELNASLDRERDEHRVMHGENIAALQRIEQKIDANEIRAQDLRHEFRDELQKVTVKIAVMSAKFQPDN
jgi:vacuolar-type H+-ATPase subunit I/STV1